MIDQFDDTKEVEIDVEPEDTSAGLEINNPFDPSKIKVDTKPYSIGQIVQDLKDEVIDLDTEFQRLPNLWDDHKKSRFIESLILNLPIPAFYFSEKDDESWEVVDGLQRISTINDFFIEKRLKLIDLEFLADFNDKSHDELPLPIQKRLSRFSITIYIISKTSPPEVKFNIFKRVNTGGLVLTTQEIRHAVNQGIPAEVIADMARCIEVKNKDNSIKIRKNADGTTTELKATHEGGWFGEATLYKISSERMEDRDFINRFVAFYLTPYTEYQPDLDSFLTRGMAKIKELSIREIQELKNNFTEAMMLAFAIFGQDSFRKRFDLADRRKPINKALFEVLSVNFANLTVEQRNLLRERANKFREKLMGLLNDSTGKFNQSISQGTAQKEMVHQRFNDILRIIKETLND